MAAFLRRRIVGRNEPGIFSFSGEFTSLSRYILEME